MLLQRCFGTPTIDFVQELSILVFRFQPKAVFIGFISVVTSVIQLTIYVFKVNKR